MEILPSGDGVLDHADETLADGCANERIQALSKIEEI